MKTEVKKWVDDKGYKHTEIVILGRSREEMEPNYLKDTHLDKWVKERVTEWFDKNPKEYYNARDERELRYSLGLEVGKKPIYNLRDDYCDSTLDRIDNAEDYE